DVRALRQALPQGSDARAGSSRNEDRRGRRSRASCVDELLAARCEELRPRIVERPELACVLVSALARPAELHLAVDRHEAGDAIVRGAVHEDLRVAAFFHRGEKLAEIVHGRIVELDGNVVIAKAERAGEARFVGKAVARIEEAEIDDGGVAARRQVAQLALVRLAGGSDAIVNREKVGNGFDGHDVPSLAPARTVRPVVHRTGTNSATRSRSPSSPRVSVAEQLFDPRASFSSEMSSDDNSAKRAVPAACGYRKHYGSDCLFDGGIIPRGTSQVLALAVTRQTVLPTSSATSNPP